MELPACLLCGQPNAQAVLCSDCLDRYRASEPPLPFVPPGWRIIDIEGADIWFGPSARPYGAAS